MNGVVKIKLLGDADQVSRFRLPNESDKSLVRFIRRDARKSSQANLTRTYVAKFEGEEKICAYISIMCAEIAFDNSYSIAEKVGADRYPSQPAVRIARLAVDKDVQKKKIGRTLVEFVIGLAKQSIQPLAGCRFVILDAKPGSVRFYENSGFRLLDTEANRRKETPLMFLDLQDFV